MSHAQDDVFIPLSVLVAAGLLMVFTMGVAGAAHMTGANRIKLPPSTAVASRDLAFADMANGGVRISDARTGRLVEIVQPETGGFLRGIMRGLVREHRLNDLAAGSAFRLTRWSDGRLSIEDPATRERFELEAFGPTNEGAFARLLEDDPAGSRKQSVAANAVADEAAGAGRDASGR